MRACMTGLTRRVGVLPLRTRSNGAIGADLTDYKLGFCMVRKSNGSGLYATKDLALAVRKVRCDHQRLPALPSFLCCIIRRWAPRSPLFRCAVASCSLFRSAV